VPKFPGPEAVEADLLRRYAEPHRRYHDVRHLYDVLDAVEMLVVHADDPDDVRLAAWFHDAVYDPAATDNEERSALLAAATLPPPRAERVARLVRLTAHHTPAPGDADGAVLCDADLAILAAPEQRYSSYAADVRAEYDHLPEEEFTSGRARIVAGLLQRHRVYATDTAYRLWEGPARHNLRRELDRLTAPGDGAALRR